LSFVEAAQALGIRRVAVAATYPAEEAALFGAFLAEVDIEVLAIDSVAIADGSGGALLSPDEIVAFARSADRPTAEAILLPDTAVATMGLLDRLETEVGKPVLTANQVTIWQGLRLAGSFQPQEGLGTLFQTAASTTTMASR
jgi:maleate isomerase